MKINLLQMLSDIPVQYIVSFRIDNETAEDLAIINVYCPRADPDREDRLLYKLRFFALLQTRAEALLKAGRYLYIEFHISEINFLLND